MNFYNNIYSNSSQTLKVCIRIRADAYLKIFEFHLQQVCEMICDRIWIYIFNKVVR